MPTKKAAKKKKKKSDQPLDKHFHIECFTAWCKKCRICIAFCPVDALREGDDGCPEMVVPHRCTGCGLCEVLCPDFAIDVIERKVEK
ncbi:MAG: 4Fe-4S binding protein [bacterium]